MRTPKVLAAAVAALFLSPLFAQDITGTWQGTLSIPAQGGARNLRTVVKISPGAGNNAFKVTFYSIDQGPGGIAGTGTLQAGSLKISLPGIGGTYEGKLDSDGVNLTGTWSQGPNPIPLNLKHVTEQQAWAIPTPPPPMKAMAANADPSFEVVTIKPSNPETPGKLFRLVSPREMGTINTTVNDMIVFAYGIHPRQIGNGPSWLDADKFDIDGKADGEGAPSQAQFKVMFQKMLADRFQLKFHHEKKELSVYAITVGKTGPKLTTSEGDPSGAPSLLFRGPGNLPARNTTMEAFAQVMQAAVLDRPVVDQTGLTGHYDFQLRWTPDETQFASLGGFRPPPGAAESPNAPPDLFTAMQEQLGLRLTATKAQVDVLVIDKVEKPSGN
jgi:uncharacterized protein (TIGR03435 family)